MKKKISSSVPKKVKNGAKPLITVSGDACFWVNNGPILSSLTDLESALNNMTDDQFHHHVAKGRNDFANWVKSVLVAPEVAKGLAASKNKKEAAICVSKALAKFN